MFGLIVRIRPPTWAQPPDPANIVYLQRDWPLGDSVGERWSLHQLQHQGPRALRLLDAVDGRDAGVVEAGEDLGLALEPGEAIRIGGERLGEDLERHPAVELGISRLIDLAGGFCCFPSFARDSWLDGLRGQAEFRRVLNLAEARHREAIVAFRDAGGERVLGVSVA